MEFKDWFSRVASGYAAHRPGYPRELFAWLAEVAPGRERAWDCACGSGQATLLLAEHFGEVIATDASRAQIEAAPKKVANVRWEVALAYQSGLAPGSTDLVTVAQALHWFDLPSFYSEAKRVLKRGGILAAWTYGMNKVEGEEINALADDFYRNVVGPYWPPERELVETGYRTIEFPFEELEPPHFKMETEWNLIQLLGYFSTWSATNRYIAAEGRNPVEALGEKLAKVWGEPLSTRRITWPLRFRVGRNAG